MATEALQQRFRLVIRVLIAATHRARLIVLQLRAQLFDTGTARQTLTFKQFAGDVEGLLGDGQFGFGFDAVLGQALTLLLRIELALLQLGAALVQILLSGPQPRQVFESAQLFAVVLQQRAEDAYLLGDGIRFGACLFEQHFELLLLAGKFFSAARGVLFEVGQFGLTFVQAITNQHQLLETIAIGIPRIAQWRQMSTLFQLSGDALQAFGDLALLILQGLNRALAVGAGLLRSGFGLSAHGHIFGQTGEGALLFEGLTQQRRVFRLALLRLGQCDFGGLKILLKLRLTFSQIGVLASVLGNLRGQRRQQRIEFGFAGELVPLRAELFQTRQLDAFAGQRFRLLLGAAQLLAGGLLRVLQQTQILEPTVLLLQLLQLRLLQLQLLLGGVKAFIQLGARFGC